jgi:type VI secretion system secreted protein VgrG
MASTLSQDTRLASLRTPLGPDELAITRLDGHEGLSELFEFKVEAVSETANLDFDKAIGRNAVVTVTAQDDKKRRFNGVLVEARWLGEREKLHVYQVVLRPWLWLLSHTANCQIFEKKTAPQIIKDIFSENGFSGSVRDDLTASYPQFEYCVQYRETDMHFVCRLMEEFGIYYYFEHSEDKHTLVLADSKSSHKPVPGLSSIEFLPTHGDKRRDKQQLVDWSVHRAFRSGRFVLNDYDYLKPNANLLADVEGKAPYEHGDMEVFDYPGRYVEQSDGRSLAKVRLEAAQAKDGRRLGVGSAVSLFPGGLVSLQRHPTGSENVEYLILGCTHTVASQGYRSDAPGSDAYYSGVYEFMPSSKPFRAPLITPKPIISGPQTAKVVGKPGEEIDVDEHGRITLQFFWDRKKVVSRRVRVAQVWSGKSWGGIVIPRIGQEVVVQFLEGDPDQPLVIGTVYNKDNTVPYTLPADKTIAGVKSNSTKGGGGYNEFIFDDKKGQELIRAHAQKDLEVKVLHDEKREVDNNQSEKIGKNVEVDVGMQQTVSIGTTYTMTANLKIELKVGASTLTIDPSGITLNAPMIKFVGVGSVMTQAPMVSTQAAGTIMMQAPFTNITGPTTIVGTGVLPPLVGGLLTIT